MSDRLVFQLAGMYSTSKMSKIYAMFGALSADLFGASADDIS